jgi:hypothetical protein
LHQLANRGFQLIGAGFIVTPEEAEHLEIDSPIKPYRNGRDLTDRPRGVKVIDLFGLSVDELRARYPGLPMGARTGKTGARSKR